MRGRTVKKDDTQRNHRGQAMVEFALVIPLLVLMALGLFDAGRAVIFYSELANASRAGARVAMVDQSNGTSCTPANFTFKCAAAAQANGTGITASDIDDVTVTGSDCALINACSVTVKVEYTFDPITPIIGNLIGPIDLAAESTMPIERLHTSS